MFPRDAGTGKATIAAQDIDWYVLQSGLKVRQIPVNVRLHIGICDCSNCPFIFHNFRQDITA